MTAPRLKKSIGRSPSRLALLLIPLLFACFAIAQSAQAITPEPDGANANSNMAEEGNALLDLRAGTESGAMGQSTPKEIGRNKWVIPIDFTRPLQCAGGNVIVHADLVVTFGNVPDLEVVAQALKLQGFRGTATNQSRKLEANPQHLKFLHYVNVDTKKREGNFGIEFMVTGPGFPGGSPLRFKVTYNPNRYKFKDGKVTHLTADASPVFKCIR